MSPSTPSPPSLTLAALLLPLFLTILSLSSCAASTQDLTTPHGFRSTKPDSGSRPPTPSWAQAEPYGGQNPGHHRHTTFTRPSVDVRIYHNLWYHNSRWYAMLPPDHVDDLGIEEGLSANNPIVRMPITDLKNFSKQIRVVFVPGNTLLLDFPFQAYPEHFGHWLELAAPLYNVLREGSWADATQSGSKVLSNVVMPNLSKFFNSWVSNVMAIAWGIGGPSGAASPNHKPSLIDYADLDATDKLGWVLFEDLVVTQDRYTHPQRESGFQNIEHGDLWRYDGCDRWVSPTYVPSFKSPAIGREFRRSGFLRSKWEPPSEEWTPGSGPAPPELPQHVTLLLPADSEPGLVNKVELEEMLHEVAAQFGLQVRAVSMTAEASFSSYVDTFSSSAVIVGRHSPALASAVFMMPGSMVLELLPFKWEWHKISMMYYNVTKSIGDIHHFAWRPRNVEASVYKESYARRYKDWFPGECHAKECLQVQAGASIVVDLEAVKALLVSKLPGILAGKSIEELAEPWPEAV